MSHAALPTSKVFNAARRRLDQWNTSGVAKDEQTMRIRALVLLSAAAKNDGESHLDVSADDFALIAQCWDPPIGA